jgi:hypothetical protein
MERLFDLPALEVEAHDSARFQALGTAAEHVLIGRLLELGHRIATPVTDDDGVDLIVNYTTLVQVKSSSKRNTNGMLTVSLNGRRSSERNGRGYIRQHIDIIAVYARDSRAWWFIPRDVIVGARNSITLSEYGRDSIWHEAWHVFEMSHA